MDGVIVDSEHQWKIVEFPFFRKLLGRWEDADHDRIVGLSVPHLYEFLVKEYGLKGEKTVFLAQCQQQALQVYTDLVSCAPGLLETLDEADAHGVPVAIASSSHHPWIAIVLKRFSLESRFKAVASADDVGGRAKPAPDVYLKAAAMLGVRASDCVAVEDSIIGVAAAKAARCTVGFRSGYNDRQDLSKADREIRGFPELDCRTLIARMPGS